MEKNKDIKISLSTFFLILAIVVIIIMGVFIYKFYNDKEVASSQVEELNKKITNLEGKNGNSNEVENEVEISSSLDSVQNLYAYLSKGNIAEELYNKSNNNIENISNEQILQIAYNYLVYCDENYKTESASDFTKEVKDDENKYLTYTGRIVSKDAIENAINKIFGKEISYKLNDFEELGKTISKLNEMVPSKLKYNSSKLRYEIYEFQGGGRGDYYANLSLNKATKTSEKIVLYVSPYFVHDDANKAEVYKDLDKDGKFNNLIYTKNANDNKDGDFIKLDDKEFSKDLHTYKCIFKLNSTGEYYFSGFEKAE